MKHESARIMVVDDDATTRQVIRLYLEELKYSVVVDCGNYDQAILCADKFEPDLILMDINLNEKERDGIDAASEILDQHNIPVIFITSFVDDEILCRAIESRPFGYLNKPVTLEALKFQIPIALENHRRIVDLQKNKAEVNSVNISQYQ
jgi:CheY-like chemotaxis protein